MTATMWKLPETGTLVAAAFAVTATLWNAPVLGSEARTSLAPAAIVSGYRIGPASPSGAMASAQRGKVRYSRSLRGRQLRVATLARQGCGWPGSPCERRFVLILGIGF